ncbi:MAG: hypothetical protein KJT03_24135, partial [Verrucomicrobiae bacterium]|nr:hypothetical protein [Verrucomicrobiae bacterium]
VKISDADSTVWGDEITLTPFNVSEQIGSPDLVFTFEDSPTGQFTNMVSEQGTGIGLQAMALYSERFQTAPNQISTVIDGPAVVTFEAINRMAIGNWELSYWGPSQYYVYASEGEWVKGATVVEDPGQTELTWRIPLYYSHDTSRGFLRNIKLQKTPALRYPQFDGPIHFGTTTRIIASFVSLGSTKAFLMKNGAETAELPIEDDWKIIIEWLPDYADSLATYAVKLENENGTTVSDPFEIFAAPPPQAGLDSELISYDSGFIAENPHDLLPGIWYTQTEDTHDGIDAIAFKDGPHNQPKEIQLELTAPAFVTFWWKNPKDSGFRIRANDSTNYLDQSGSWQQFKVLVTDAPQTIRWDRGIEGAIMD